MKDSAHAPQLALFESAPSTVHVGGHSSGMHYSPGFIAAAQAQAWFEDLRDHVAWSRERRLMYEREVDVPRLVAHYALDDDAQVPEAVREASARVSAKLRVAFNSAGLNWYRDGRDSVAPHNDRLEELEPGAPIALVSLGATRRMTIRAKSPPRRALHLELEAGSLLVMSYASQLAYLHGIPKTREDAGARVSLALRVRPRAKNRRSE